MLAALFLGFTLLITSSTGTPDVKQAERIRNIEDSLLSPCCYGGQVSTHMSEIAAQMRQEIAQMVLDGRSDKEIRDYYVRQYGQQVLAEPEGPRRLMLYGIPVTITVAGIVFVMVFLRRALRTKNHGPMIIGSGVQPDAAALRRVRADLKDL
jgi:cytochrome c-type biogenesis protein CcmH/NrfF